MEPNSTLEPSRKNVVVDFDLKPTRPARSTTAMTVGAESFVIE